MNDHIDVYADSLEVNENAVRDLQSLAQHALDLQSEIESLQAQAADRQKELTQLLQHKMPERLLAAGVSRLDLRSGHVIELKDIVTGSLPKDEERRRRALELLRKKGHGDLIKGEMSVTIEKGKDNVAHEAAAQLEQLGFHPEFSSTVHPQTLQAWARERYASDDERDWLVESAETLGLYIAKQATIKEPKKRKSNG